MTASTSGAAPADETAWARRLAHTRVAAITALAVFGGVVSLPWVPPSSEMPPGWRVLYYAVGLSALAWMTASELCWTRHPMAVCVRCLTDTPTDGAVQATRYARRLWVVHYRKRRNVTLAVLAAFVVYAVGEATAIAPLQWLAAAVLIGWWWNEAWETAAQRTHLRLAPWCPYCDNGGDGDPVHEPLPDTTGEKVRT